MQILYTIIPIFIIVLIGWGVRKKGILPSDFFRPANLLVYYLAIPALIFRSISGSSIGENFHGDALFLTLGAVVASYGIAWLVCRIRRTPRNLAGTFIQSAGHGNLGYIGFAVAFYFLGDSGLVKASLIAGFLMILQNLLSVVALRLHAVTAHQDAAVPGGKGLLGSIFGNPVIISAMAGILVSFFQLPIPRILQGVLDILSGMALPMALLLIGGSLSLELVRKYFGPSMVAIFIKLMVLPAVGLGLFVAFDVSVEEFLPGLILLATPTATITYVMSREMQGDPDFAAASISASTLLSAVTISFWLFIAG